MPAEPVERIADTLDRMTRILAGIFLKGIEGEDQNAQIARLKGCGFGNSEIAEMLGTTPNVVNVSVHRSLRKKRRRRRKRKPK
jgi:DNA-binding NarL/FixJ family response regulator